MSGQNYTSINSLLHSSPKTNDQFGEMVFSPPKKDAPTEPKSHKIKLRFIVIPVLLISLLLGLAAGVFTKYQREEKTISQEALNQVMLFQELEGGYKQIVAMIQGANKATTVENPDRVLGAFSSTIDRKEGEVLGLEDNPNIKFIRQYIKVLNSNLDRVEKIETNNQIIERELGKTLIFKLAKSGNPPPLEASRNFVNSSKATLNYLEEMETISIELITLAFNFGNAIDEVILRGADEASVEMLGRKLEEIRDIKAKAELVNVAGLSPEMKTDHQKQIDSFEDDIAPLTEIYEAMKNKDSLLLQRALISIMSQSYASSESGLTEEISFWQGNEALGAVEKTKKLWVNYRNSL